MKSIRLAGFMAAAVPCRLPARVQPDTTSHLHRPARPSGDDSFAEDGLETAARCRPRCAAPHGWKPASCSAAVRFLRAIETMLQVRYDSYDATGSADPGNDAAAPATQIRKPQFKPEFVETALKGALEHLSMAQEQRWRRQQMASSRPSCRWTPSGSISTAMDNGPNGNR